MSHLKTIAHPDIYSANNLELVSEDSFVLTNDHSGKGMSGDIALPRWISTDCCAQLAS
jgi:hypothetical protein